MCIRDRFGIGQTSAFRTESDFRVLVVLRAPLFWSVLFKTLRFTDCAERHTRQNGKCAVPHSSRREDFGPAECSEKAGEKRQPSPSILAALSHPFGNCVDVHTSLSA
eukprot:8529648-Alexandrium_andersonii.AAC.1